MLSGPVGAGVPAGPSRAGAQPFPLLQRADCRPSKAIGAGRLVQEMD